ncbi:MAG: ribonuclease III domain-containing protein [Angelakisella sp.]
MTSLSPDVQNPKLLSSLNLAFVGDGVYELLVRQHLAALGSMPMGRLHRMTVKMVCAEAQSNAVEILLPLLTEEEEAVYKRGRNSSTAGVPRHSDPAHYRRATGVEALFGWLYLAGQTERVNELFSHIAEDAQHDEGTV